MNRFIKRRLFGLFERLNLDVNRGPSLATFLHDREIDLVLDVGANEGQFGDAVRDRGYRGRILSFEPIASVFRTLKKKIAKDDKWNAECVALGDSSGDRSLNISELSVFSSFLPTTALAETLDSHSATMRTERVAIRTLDNYKQVLEGKRVFLKIDTQGFEKQVMDGAAAVLGDLIGIQLELPIDHLYEGVWEFEDAIRYMRERGFLLSQMHPVARMPLDRASLLEVDCIFRRNA